MQRADASDQVIAGAGLRHIGTRFQRHIFGVDADIHFGFDRPVVGGRGQGDKLLLSDRDGCEAIRNLHDPALLDSIYAHDMRDVEVGRRGKDLLHRATLAHPSSHEIIA